MPQVFQVTQIARPNYYDRQPTGILVYYTNVVAPHGSTVRGTYTVPVGRVAFLELFFLNGYRNNAAAATGLVQAYVEFTPNGGVASRILQIQFFTNTQYTGDRQQSPTFGQMKAGDNIRFSTFDGSTGGDCGYILAIKGVEFDA